MMEALLMVALTAYIGSTLTAQTYTESLLNDGSAPDDRSDNLYQVLTLTASLHGGSLKRRKRY